jgi:hypothetical protein
VLRAVIIGIAALLPASAAPNSCELLRPPEIAAVLKTSVPEETPQPGWAGSQICRWVGPADQAVGLQVYPGGLETFRALLKQAAGRGSRPRRIPFAGDEAVWAAGRLLVVRGSFVFTISINQSMTDLRRIWLSAGLARKVVARLDAARNQTSSSAR